MSEPEKESSSQEVPNKENLIIIAGKEFELGKSEETDRDLRKLKWLVDAEGGHLQWKKQGLNLGLLVFLILMNLCLGSSSQKSIIGIHVCDGAYWGIYAAFLALCVISTFLAIYLAKTEQALKLRHGNINIVASDIKFTFRKIVTVTSCGFCGGLIAGALGLGGGVIYNPVMLMLGLPPVVSAASGLYLVTFSKIATTVVYIINN